MKRWVAILHLCPTISDYQIPYFIQSSYILRRPQNFEKYSPIIWLAVHRTNNWWRFHKILWPSQNIWTLNNRNYLIPLWYNRFAVNFEESFHCAFWVLGMARRTSKHYSMYNLLVISSNPTIFPLEKYQFCDVLKTFSINIPQREWFYMLLCHRNLKYFNT